MNLNRSPMMCMLISIHHLLHFRIRQESSFLQTAQTQRAKATDTTIPPTRYNIFLADNYNKSEFRQITQLSNMKYGDARFPTQYNTSHFTFISDENGVANRYAGFFHTQRAGIDTIYVVGNDFLRNPDDKDLDSALKAGTKRTRFDLCLFCHN